MFARIRFLATPWLWLGLSLAIWALGVGGRDLYALPGLVGLVLLGVWLRTGDLKGLWKKVAAFPGRQHKLVLAGYAGLATVFVATTVLKLYSFRWSVFDVGIYSNVVFHYEQGQVHSSFLGMSAWADHFTPSLAVLAPGFWIIPSAHWLTLGKCVAYLVTPAAGLVVVATSPGASRVGTATCGGVRRIVAPVLRTGGQQPDF